MTAAADDDFFTIELLQHVSCIWALKVVSNVAMDQTAKRMAYVLQISFCYCSILHVCDSSVSHPSITVDEDYHYETF